MYILGISCYYHDSSACLLKDGEIVAASAEERFSRIKHDFSFPYNAIRYCLQFGKVKGKDLDCVVFYEKPFLKFERIIKTILATFPASYNLFKDAASNWLKTKLWIKATISDFLDMPYDKILFCEHHLAHAASSFFCSFFKEAAVMNIDGVGEWATTTLGFGKTDKEVGKDSIYLFKEMRFPHSLGLLYSVFTAFLGFKVNNGEYKVMGLAGFGKPLYKDKIYKLIDLKEDGSFRLNMKYFSYHYSTARAFSSNFIKLFGINPRLPSQKIEQIHYDIAATLQHITEDILIKQANYLYSLVKTPNLCLAGGVALNCVANYKILEHTPFKNIYIQPNAGDGGGAIGAALYAYYSVFKNKRNYVMENAYLGPEYTDLEIKNFLDSHNIEYKGFAHEKDLIEYTAKELISQKVIGWFYGRAEWGPRALGNRSILADARNAKMKDILNSKIKFRERFRPFAPSVLYEHAEEIFDVADIKGQYPFKFMLYSLPVKDNIIPAATHVDNTARPQFVKKEDNPLYHSLIQEYYKLTGIPAIINTSFNLKGEPIVNSPQDAYNTFIRSGMDILILGRCVVEKNCYWQEKGVK